MCAPDTSNGVAAWRSHWPAFSARRRGSSLGKSFPGDRLVSLFGVLMIAVALAMAIGRPIGGNAGVRLDAKSAARLAPWLLLYGAGVGFMSGFFGIGGGFLAVPGLLMATDMPLVFAIGTSLISVAAFGMATALNYAVSGLVDWGVAALFLSGGVVGGMAGTRLARALASRRHALSRIFAVIVAWSACFWSSKRKISRKRHHSAAVTAIERLRRKPDRLWLYDAERHRRHG